MFRRSYAEVYAGDEFWAQLESPTGDRFAWSDESTYIHQPPYFLDMPREAPGEVDDIAGARVIALLGDSVTTDHISPAGTIKRDSPAGSYLMGLGVEPRDFNSYGSRRGNHNVMVRGTFANVRIRNRLAPETEGGVTTFLPDGEVMSIYDAAMKYRRAGTPLIVLAGKEYGSGSSRDWAAKGPHLMGIKAVIACSFERIHRSNLVGMGILPLQFKDGASAESIGLTGREVFDFRGLSSGVAEDFSEGRSLQVVAQPDDGPAIEFQVDVRLDTPTEIQYYRHGGILQYVLRQLAGERVSGSVPPDKTNSGSLKPELENKPGNNQVDQASRDSFPASDPPPY
jgi:aconitate hydratase